ncbi:three-helix bundle dimerization domain-containing protein [Streptomyces sp. NPDC047000]|uniref:three-helix bundle dimerization domain-containing protein n=1 Tax=Streptomyces sp. NPDC047000 TaxID=3155474 RepID=UPI0033CB74A0
MASPTGEDEAIRALAERLKNTFHTARTAAEVEQAVARADASFTNRPVHEFVPRAGRTQSPGPPERDGSRAPASRICRGAVRLAQCKPAWAVVQQVTAGAGILGNSGMARSMYS